jgi:hypothetical protein
MADNIDTRLERLTERHEALAQTMELMAHQQDANLTRIEGALAGLLKIAENHEKRIEHLEGQ